MFAFLSVESKSKEICEEISFPSFFQKNADAYGWPFVSKLQQSHDYSRLQHGLWLQQLSNFACPKQVLVTLLFIAI